MIIQTYLPNKNPGPGIKAIRIEGSGYSIYLYDNRAIAVSGVLDEKITSTIHKPGPGDHAKTAAYKAVMKEILDTIPYSPASKASFASAANTILSKAGAPFKVTDTLGLMPNTAMESGGHLFIPKSDWNTALSKAINTEEITLDEERAGKLIKVMRDLVVQWNPALEPIDGNQTNMKFEAEIGIMEKAIEPGGTYSSYVIYKPKNEAAESKIFKVGDLVEIVGPTDPDEKCEVFPGYYPNAMKKFIGQKLEITEVKGGNVFHIGYWDWLGDWLKPVIKKFKRWDKVKIISHEATNKKLPGHACRSNQDYAIGTIHTIIRNFVPSDPGNKEAVLLELYWMATDDLELVE